MITRRRNRESVCSSKLFRYFKGKLERELEGLQDEDDAGEISKQTVDK